LKDVTFFCTAYYCWIWQCYLSLGKWPYDFLDLRERLGNSIFFGVAVAMYGVVLLSFWACQKQEKREQAKK